MEHFDELMNKNSLISHFEMKVVSHSESHLTMSMPVTDKVRQPYGYLHGGATVALCETVASMGSALVSDEDKIPLGLEINANHISSVKDGTVTAEGKLLHKGNATHVWEIKVFNDEKKLICASRCTVAIKTIRKNV